MQTYVIILGELPVKLNLPQVMHLQWVFRRGSEIAQAVGKLAIIPFANTIKFLAPLLKDYPAQNTFYSLHGEPTLGDFLGKCNFNVLYKVGYYTPLEAKHLVY